MRGDPSFHRINYSVRTNKNIERKLVFGLLQKLMLSLNIPAYRYIGLGSLWFTDFVLAHRMLEIDDMWSIEREENYRRAEFNAPYACITVKSGTSSEVLAGMKPEDWTKNTIAWLDYDGAFDEDVRTDCDRFLQHAVHGSMLIVSVNANRANYKPSQGESDKAVEGLKEIFRDCVPADVPPPGKADVNATEFPSALNRSILNFMAASVRQSGRSTDGDQHRFVPLFELQHIDGATICTAGGLVASRNQVQELSKAFSVTEDEVLDGHCSLVNVLDLIPLTHKEKLLLDRMLPSDQVSFATKCERSELAINSDQAEKYRMFYTHFPLFAETLI